VHLYFFNFIFVCSGLTGFFFSFRDLGRCADPGLFSTGNDRTMLSALFVFNHKGEVLIYRLYREDIR